MEWLRQALDYNYLIPTLGQNSQLGSREYWQQLPLDVSFRAWPLYTLLKLLRAVNSFELCMQAWKKTHQDYNYLNYVHYRFTTDPGEPLFAHTCSTWFCLRRSLTILLLDFINQYHFPSRILARCSSHPRKAMSIQALHCLILEVF
jgi:hypothetical protein